MILLDNWYLVVSCITAITIYFIYSPEDIELEELSEISEQSKKTSYIYRHSLWPSPRPINFLRHLIAFDHGITYNGRLTHAKAIDILASRANITPQEFLTTDPNTYARQYMPHPPYLIQPLD